MTFSPPRCASSDVPTEHPLGRGRPVCLLLAGLLLAASALYGTARAQQADTSQALPDIAPQEVEIRGRLDVAFPSLERQPLVGFNPPPSTYEVPSERTPYVEEYKQEAADLPASPLQRPELPAATEDRTDRSGVLEAAVGRYLDRRVELHARTPAGEATELFTDLSYGGTRGVRPYAHDTRSRFDRFDGLLGVRARQPGWSWTGEVEGFYDGYPLFGAADPSGGHPAQPDRRASGATGRFTVRGDGARPSDLSVAYHAGRFETEGPDTSGGAFVDRERRVRADGALTTHVGSVRLTAEGTAATSDLTGSGLLGSDLVSYDGGFLLAWDRSSALDLEVGGRILGFRSTAANGGADRAYVAPQVRVRLQPTDRLEVYARTVPDLDRAGLDRLFRESPFTVPDPVVLPGLATVGAEAGLHHYLGPLQYNLHAGLRRYELYRYYRRATLPPGGHLRGFVRPGYEAARVLELGGTISYHRPGGAQAQLGVSLRRGRLNDRDVRIPYFAPLVADLSLTVPFADDRGQITVRGAAHLGTRYVDPTQTGEVGGYVDLDGRIGYRIADPIGLFVEMDDVAAGDLERWKGYPRPTYIARGGLTVSW